MTIHNLEINTAYFTNNERTEIQVMLVSEKSTEDHAVLIPYNIEAKIGDADYEWLIGQFPLENLHETTFNKFRLENERFKENIRRHGLELGIIKEPELEPEWVEAPEPEWVEPVEVKALDEFTYEKLADTLLEPFDADEKKEQIFLLKLKLFDSEEIKSSSNRLLKSKLRKAKDLISVIKYATMIASPEPEDLEVKVAAPVVAKPATLAVAMEDDERQPPAYKAAKAEATAKEKSKKKRSRSPKK